MHKIGVLGGGNVGAMAAFICATRQLGHIAIYDIQEGVPAGKALDMAETAPVLGFDARVTGSHDPAILTGSDLVIVAAGFPRKAGMARMDLLKKNVEIARSAGKILKKFAPNAIVVSVTNPLDVMTWVVQQESGFEPSRVIGMAGILDSARFAAFIAMELGCSPKDVRPMVLGGHGDAMVPVPRFSTVNGVPVTDLITRDTLTAMIERTKKGGAEIVKLLGTGSAFYAPGASAVLMAEAILNDTHRLLPCSTWAAGAYGIDNAYVGLPVMLGRSGVMKIIEVPLNMTERESLRASADRVAQGIEDVKSLSK